MPIGAMHRECLCLNLRIQSEVTSFRVKRNQAIASGVIFICFFITFYIVSLFCFFGGDSRCCRWDNDLALRAGALKRHEKTNGETARWKSCMNDSGFHVVSVQVPYRLITGFRMDWSLVTGFRTDWSPDSVRILVYLHAISCPKSYGWVGHHFEGGSNLIL